MAEQIPKGAPGTRRIFSLLRKGEAALLLVDQRASEGITIPFFGRDAFTTPAPAALALKLGAVVVPASNERVGGALSHDGSPADRAAQYRRSGARSRRPPPR
jgi:KDO2-lipid IV(A) lauroyltransferase